MSASTISCGPPFGSARHEFSSGGFASAYVFTAKHPLLNRIEAPDLKMGTHGVEPPHSSLPLERIARDTLLPRLDGFDLMAPSPFDRRRQPSVLVYREPIEDVLVGIELVSVDEHEFSAQYVAMPLFTPTDYPGFEDVGMERDGIKRLLRVRRWILDGRHDAQVIDRLATYVVREGTPILRRRAALVSFADELIEDPHELESDPISTEQAAYARILIGDNASATELLETLINMTGRGWPGEAEIPEDEMNVLRERARRMLANLREDRPAALHQLARWRLARLEGLKLTAPA